jgi:hypothetical protein
MRQAVVDGVRAEVSALVAWLQGEPDLSLRVAERMRWTEAGAEAMAPVRVLLTNDEWATYWETDTMAS